MLDSGTALANIRFIGLNSVSRSPSHLCEEVATPMSISPRGTRWTGLLLGATLAVAGAGCGGGGDGPAGPGGGGGPTVSRIDLTPGSASVIVGQISSFIAQPKDATGAAITGQNMAWSISDPSVATVAGGVVTAVKVGSATITAAVGSVKGTAAVTVIAAVASVTLSPNPANFVVGQTNQLTATLKDAGGATITDRTVTWTSSNDLIASISSTGLVTSQSLGSATITATVEGKAGTASIVVSPVPVATVTVSPASSSMIVGGTVQLSAVTKDANGGALAGRAITWSSGDQTIATVTADGVVTAKAAGSVSITATAEGKSAASSITVTLAPVQSVVVAPSTVSVLPGQTTQLTATVSDAAGLPLTGRIVSWTTSDATKATVSGTGLVTGVAYGSVTIQATSEGKTGNATVKVTDTTSPILVGLTISPSTADVTTGAKTVTATAHIVDAGGSGTLQFALVATAPHGAFASCTTRVLVSGTAADGTWSCPISIPAGAEPGNWQLLILVTDVASNSRSYSAADLNAGGLPSTFAVVSTWDRIFPGFQSLSIAPATVNVSTGSKTIVVTATITDDVSGVASFEFVGTATNGQTVGCSAVTPSTGTNLDGTWICTVTIPATAATGDWSISIKATDGAFNYRSYDRITGFPSGFPSIFTVTR